MELSVAVQLKVIYTGNADAESGRRFTSRGRDQGQRIEVELRVEEREEVRVEEVKMEVRVEEVKMEVRVEEAREAARVEEVREKARLESRIFVAAASERPL
ncbi:hypothetical protein CRUP_000821 [Coryphaenoides rupestris]|nr:hypothetical protein CRUP_000821 [Coryphaenoides rupestris]